MDFAEQIESVAYVICGDKSQVSFKNFRDIWHTRGVSMHPKLDYDISIYHVYIWYIYLPLSLQILDKLYRLIDIDGTNLISTNQVMEFISHLTNSR